MSVGCKIYITRTDADGKTEERLAEILSIRDKPGYVEGNNDDLTNKLEFFVHWDSFNKRLDEWVSGTRLLLSHDLEWPRPKPPPQKKKPVPKAPLKAPRGTNLLKRAATANALAAAGQGGLQTPNLKRKAPLDEEDEEEDAEGEVDTSLETIDLTAPVEPPKAPPVFSKEQEIEKLRTSGSMTQSISEIARVKNLNRLQIGQYEVEAWYFSPYPKEYAHLPILYICEFCLSFFPSSLILSRHRRRCTLLHPPGNEIYRHEDISFFEIDGRRQLAWCRNLSLLSKCFLDQ